MLVKPAPVDRPIFVIGVPRSGTTVIFNTFAARPDIAWFTQHLNRMARWPSITVLGRLADRLPGARKSIPRSDSGRRWREKARIGPVEGYRIWRDNLVGFTNDATVDDEGNVMMPNFVNEGFGGTYGLEVLIKREVSDRLYGWLSYTYSHSEVHLPFLSGEGVLPTGFDQTHVANLVASWVPDATVYAPEVVSNAKYAFDEDGRFVAPRFMGGKAVTYVVEPGATVS